MSEEENAPKKAARKRVVKKGVRGTRAPRKAASAPIPEEEDTFELASPPASVADAAQERPENDLEKGRQADDPSPADRKAEGRKSGGKKSDNEQSEDHPKKESADEEATTIEVVEEDSEKPRREDGRSQSSEGSSAREEREDPAGSEDGEDRRENSRRRGRNRRGGGNRDREEGGNSSKGRALDAKEAAEKAWEIYQGELEEEGVSLVDPRRAREVARRCLELASIFCEERDRFLDRS